MKRRVLILALLVGVVAAAVYFESTKRPSQIVLTGIVTADQIVVGSEIQGRLQQMLVEQGATVTNNQLLAVIQPKEWKAEMAFYANSELQSQAQVSQAEADLRYQEARSSNQVVQAEANLAAANAQVVQGEADLENAKLNFHRLEGLYHQGVESSQSFDQARTANDAAQAHVDALRKQAQAAEAAVALAKAGADQVAARRAGLAASVHQQAAMGAQKEKAEVRLNYTEIRAPSPGIVDTRVALLGEVVEPGQAVVTLIDPDKLWVRVDVEEGSIDRIHLGDKIPVRLPSGAVREGTVFYRGADADYATQRDVSRTKRDIKTFEIRLRCDNQDRSLALGMTAYATLDLNRPR